MLAPLATSNDLPVTLPNPSSTMLVRPLAVPLALVALAIGFVLWKFMGAVPGTLKIGLAVLQDVVRQGDRGAREGNNNSPLVLAGPAAIDAIKSHDASFEGAAFLQYATVVAQSLAEAWLQQDLAGCRGNLSPDYWALEQAQLLRGLAQGWRRYPAGLSVSARQLMAAELGPTRDSVTVRMRMAPSADGLRTVRGRRVAEWIEDWTFSRSVSSGVDATHGVSLGSWQLDRTDHVAIHFELAA